MNAAVVKTTIVLISKTISENRDYLIELDQQNGDGDLGISMDGGFRAIAEYALTMEETDLGKIFFQMSKIFNDKAPSSLGTILSFCLMGMARSLKNKESASLAETAEAFHQGVALIMEKAGSKAGEKTILDSLCPAVGVLRAAAANDAGKAFAAAAEAASAGSESTRQMLPKHGRAAYYGEKNIGLLDGGSVVGKLIFETLAAYTRDKGCCSG